MPDETPATFETPARRKPTDDEWEWTYRRVTGRDTGHHYEASMALLHIVWSAVHEHGWSLPDVSPYQIKLRRYNAADESHSELHLWRDRLGRCRGADEYVIRQTAKHPTITDVRDALR